MSIVATGAGKVAEGLSKPLFTRKVTQRWNPETQEWEPFEKETEVAGPSLVGVGVAAVAAGAALWIAGLGVQPVQVPKKVTVPNPAHADWERDMAAWQYIVDNRTRQQTVNPEVFRITRDPNIDIPPRPVEPVKTIRVDDPAGTKRTRLALVVRRRWSGGLLGGGEGSLGGPAEIVIPGSGGPYPWTLEDMLYPIWTRGKTPPAP